MTQEITMWSAGVRIFGKNKRAIEDMTIENFPATTKANAHAFAVQKGMEHLKELGLDQEHGVSIFFMEEHKVSDGNRKTTALTVIDGGKRGSQGKPRVKYKPFSCPVSSLCSEHYLGVKENGVFNVVKAPKET